MKRSFKLVALLIAVVLMAASLCSCEELDKKKANRGIYSDDRKEITYQDNVYRLITAGKYEIITGSYNWDWQYVTTKDVPVLLAETYGDSMDVLNNGAVLRVTADISDFPDEAWENSVGQEGYIYSTYVYYVRSDQYNEVKDTIDKAELDHYYFEYWGYDEDNYYDSTDMLNESRPYASGEDYIQILLDEDLTELINSALKATEKDKVSYRELSTGDYDLKVIDLAPCDNNKIVTRSDVIYYLVQDHEKYYFWDGNYFNDIAFYPFSEDDAVLLKELFEKYPDAISYDDILYQFNNTYAYDI